MYVSQQYIPISIIIHTSIILVRLKKKNYNSQYSFDKTFFKNYLTKKPDFDINI